MRVLLAAALAALALPAGAEAAPRCLTKSKPHARKCQRLPVSAHSLGRATGMRMVRNAAIATPLPQPVSEAPAPPAPPARLGVVAREFSLVLSRTTLRSGAAVIELQNRGEDAHNLRIERADGFGLDVPLAEAGEVRSASASLTPGEYRLFCALPGHDAAGMHARLTVSP